MITRDLCEYIFSIDEVKQIKDIYLNNGRRIEEAFIECLSQRNGTCKDAWLYQYHEEMSDGSFRLILSTKSRESYGFQI